MALIFFFCKRQLANPAGSWSFAFPLHCIKWTLINSTLFINMNALIPQSLTVPSPRAHLREMRAGDVHSSRTRSCWWRCVLVRFIQRGYPGIFEAGMFTVYWSVVLIFPQAFRGRATCDMLVWRDRSKSFLEVLQLIFFESYTGMIRWTKSHNGFRLLLCFSSEATRRFSRPTTKSIAW